MRFLALSILLLASSAADATPIRVAVEDGSGSGTGSNLVTQLNNDTYYDFTATLVTASDIDSASELANYDVVMFGASGYGTGDHDWTTTMATATASWAAEDNWGCALPFREMTSLRLRASSCCKLVTFPRTF